MSIYFIAAQDAVSEDDHSLFVEASNVPEAIDSFFSYVEDDELGWSKEPGEIEVVNIFSLPQPSGGTRVLPWFDLAGAECVTDQWEGRDNA
ncbi:hypothetical protein [Roseibium sp. Sym1]|uniref:hypothetical protein n=1 Tax=Roseibium sp. Sym1 TaxID=3016006 RepID=UPI0022B31DBF|nr:hypothetical protein [Roseibium sp. Sym1]